ncbi:uncharacterized protein LOC129582063 [Paramacrobiotus metropolitanus]|uniref:uncharacterized protein LOC129582063 n=1 Tax=Paramacrobiotus metropolitanus TaxID=2943436 RepID=UPI0024457C34|nr:uncharacterized protein LOC129582063 [Paramacrobiotus metropolitanus]XP_055329433.1 uncharacterized protein LOC129582063 [Paramacrobiotus metropolitanus]
MPARTISFRELPKLAPPSAEIFWQRLGEKGFIQPPGNIFGSAAPQSDFYSSYYLAENQFSPGSFDTDQLPSDLLATILEDRKWKNCSEDGTANVKIHLAAFEPAVVTNRANGSFSGMTVLPFSFVPTIKEKVYVRKLALPGLRNVSGRYYKYDPRFRDIFGEETGIKSLRSRPLNRAYSFRMYLDRPMSIQLMPELERLMQKRLNANTTENSTSPSVCGTWTRTD